MQFARRNLMTIRGYSPNEIQQMLDTRKAWTGYLRDENSRAAALNALRNAEVNLVYLPKASELTGDPEHSSYRRKMDDNPASAVTKVRVPLLFLYGDSDPWIPVAKSIEQLQSLSKQSQNIEYAVVPDANHEMMLPLHDTMQIDQSTIRYDAPQAVTYFMLLSSWISRHVAN